MLNVIQLVSELRDYKALALSPVFCLCALVLKTLRYTLMMTDFMKQAVPRHLFSLQTWENGAFQRRDLTCSRSHIESTGLELVFPSFWLQGKCPLASLPHFQERRLEVGAGHQRLVVLQLGHEVNPLHHDGKTVSERVRDLPKVTQLVGIHLTWNPGFLTLPLCFQMKEPGD